MGLGVEVFGPGFLFGLGFQVLGFKRLGNYLWVF